jgi:hypothetical protein
MSRNCTLNQQVHSNKGNAAPGTRQSNAVSFAQGDEAEGDDSGEEGVEVLDELQCGSVRFQLEDSHGHHYDDQPDMSWQSQIKTAQHDEYINYLQVRGVTPRVTKAMERATRRADSCPEDVRNHRLERLNDDSRRFGDPVAERILRQLELNIVRLPHLWECWKNEDFVAPCMTKLRNGLTPWAIYDPALDLPILLPLELVIHTSLDLGGWYRQRIDEFLDLARKFECDSMGLEPEDYLEDWMISAGTNQSSEEDASMDDESFECKPEEEEYDSDGYPKGIRWLNNGELDNPEE